MLLVQLLVLFKDPEEEGDAERGFVVHNQPGGWLGGRCRGPGRIGGGLRSCEGGRVGHGCTGCLSLLLLKLVVLGEARWRGAALTHAASSSATLTALG